MSKMLNALREKAPEKIRLTGKMKSSGCSISLQGARPRDRLIIDMDEAKGHNLLGLKNCKICDYLFFAKRSLKNLWFVPIEMKSGGVGSDIIQQFTDSIKAVERELITRKDSHCISFRPVLAHNGLRKRERSHIKALVSFYGDEKPLLTMRCGGELMQELSRA